MFTHLQTYSGLNTLASQYLRNKRNMEYTPSVNEKLGTPRWDAIFKSVSNGGHHNNNNEITTLPKHTKTEITR